MQKHEPPTTPGPPVPARNVAWRRVALFYGIALTGPAVIALIVATAGLGWDGGPSTMALGALTMAVPLIAGLLTERMAGRTPLLTRQWRAFRAARLETVGRVAGWAALTLVLTAAALLVGATLFALAGMPGAGHWASDSELVAALRELQPALPAGFTVPMPVFVAMSVLQGIVAGFTLNGLLGFGEEYGWRGVLLEELRPLGLRRATLLIGVLWGLWHAPLIVLGHNYGPDWGWGIPAMVVLCIPLGALLLWVRERTGFVAAPAIVHGAFNGFAGTFSLGLVGANPLVGFPTGLLAALTLAVLATVLWGLWPPVAQDQARLVARR